MAPTSNILRAARPILRQRAAGSSPFFTSQNQQFFRQQFRQQGKRWQSTASGEQQQSTSWFKKAWESEVGIKTVHFWAPVMKVGFSSIMPSDFLDWRGGGITIGELTG